MPGGHLILQGTDFDGGRGVAEEVSRVVFLSAKARFLFAAGNGGEGGSQDWDDSGEEGIHSSILKL